MSTIKSKCFLADFDDVFITVLWSFSSLSIDNTYWLQNPMSTRWRNLKTLWLSFLYWRPSYSLLFFEFLFYWTCNDSWSTGTRLIFQITTFFEPFDGVIDSRLLVSELFHAFSYSTQRPGCCASRFWTQIRRFNLFSSFMMNFFTGTFYTNNTIDMPSLIKKTNPLLVILFDS